MIAARISMTHGILWMNHVRVTDRQCTCICRLGIPYPVHRACYHWKHTMSSVQTDLGSTCASWGYCMSSPVAGGAAITNHDLPLRWSGKKMTDRARATKACGTCFSHVQGLAHPSNPGSFCKRARPGSFNWANDENMKSLSCIATSRKTTDVLSAVSLVGYQVHTIRCSTSYHGFRC